MVKWSAEKPLYRFPLVRSLDIYRESKIYINRFLRVGYSKWSAEMISGHVSRSFPLDILPDISPWTIFQTISSKIYPDRRQSSNVCGSCRQSNFYIAKECHSSFQLIFSKILLLSSACATFVPFTGLSHWMLLPLWSMAWYALRWTLSECCLHRPLFLQNS